MSAPAQDLLRLSYPEYLELERRSEEKHEYVNGVVYAMAGGSIEHARLAMEFGRRLGNALEGKPCRTYSADLRLRVEGTGRSTYADVTVVCGKPQPALDDPDALTNPKVIAEVLSDGTEGSDRGDRWRHYQSFDSLEEYVLVSQHQREVEIFHRNGSEWRYQRLGPGQRVRLESLGVEIGIDELYATTIGG